MFEVPADLDVERLELALRHAVDRHDAFRLRYRRVDDGWRQAYAATVDQLERLIAPDQMGDLFKAIAIHSPGLAAPGFEETP